MLTDPQAGQATFLGIKLVPVPVPLEKKDSQELEVHTGT